MVFGQRHVEKAERRIALAEARRNPLIGRQPDDEHDERDERNRHRDKEAKPQRRDAPRARSGSVVWRNIHAVRGSYGGLRADGRWRMAERCRGTWSEYQSIPT